jgi:NAD(P)-dependent dehydrogenase (short-subunit alcohol dehydrogenase family)
MEDFRHKAVVVTGAASGMGKAIALAFAREGSRLALADLNAEGLERTADEARSLACDDVYTRVVDVSAAEEMREFRDAVYARMGAVDILCNIAGVGAGGRFEDIPLEDWDWILGANMWGVIYGCHFFYPRMKERNAGGHIVNISSLTGLAPGVFATPYVTTKQAVQGFTETLRAEAALHGIGVSALCPGFVDTNIGGTTRIHWGSALLNVDDFVARLRKSRGTGESRREPRLISPQKVAREVLEGIRKNRGVIMVGLDSYVPDIAYRISRRGYGYILKRMASFVMGRMRDGVRRPCP